MSDKINGRTPEEIKKGLECCQHDPYNGLCNCHDGCPYWPIGKCDHLRRDALAYIQQLERERDEARRDADKLKHAAKEATDNYFVMLRERDAAVELLHGFCGACANEGKHEICVECSRRLPFEPDDKDDYWQWRGVQEVENNA